MSRRTSRTGCIMRPGGRPFLPSASTSTGTVSPVTSVTMTIVTHDAAGRSTFSAEHFCDLSENLSLNAAWNFGFYSAHIGSEFPCQPRVRASVATVLQQCCRECGRWTCRVMPATLCAVEISCKLVSSLTFCLSSIINFFAYTTDGFNFRPVRPYHHHHRYMA